MADFALLLCAENEEVVRERPLSSISNKIRSLFKSKEVQLRVNKVELYRDLNMYVINLQDSVTNVMNLKEKRLNDILGAISDILINNNIKECIIPEYVPDRLQTIGCIKKRYSGQYLYMSLLLHMINEMLTSNRKDINELEIAIINGEDKEKLFAIIHLLLPKIKYLTLISKKEDLLEENINEICSDAGLSIRLASDTKSALKDIDLIINLSNSYEFKPSHKLKSSAIILNFDEAITSCASIENVIINRIDIGLPTILKSKVEANLLKSFSSLEVTEIVLSHKYDIENKILEADYNYEGMKILAKGFKEGGYKIEGFIGRRGLLKKIV